jgi:pectinesterase
VTCLDGLDDGPLRDSVGAHLEPLKSLASASLAVLSAAGRGARDVLAEAVDRFPSWLTARDRTLLDAGAGAVQADVVVAKDGSGKYTTIKEAVDAAPDGGKSRYVIYVKKGVYKENLEVGKTKRVLMIVGDGMDQTVITGSRNVVDGSTTFNSATLGDALDRRLRLCLSLLSEIRTHSIYDTTTISQTASLLCIIQPFQKGNHNMIIPERWRA